MKSPRGESSDVAGIALLASALGNLWQANKRADLEKDREHVLSVLREWQTDHARISARLASLAKACEGLEGVARTLREQNEQLEREKQGWRTKYFEAEKKLGKASKPNQEAPSRQP